MDLRQYFKKIRDVEAGIPELNTHVISLDTSDGGKAGAITEVKRALAAKLIVEGRAVLATKAEIESYLEQQFLARTAAQRADTARQLQVAIISDGEGGWPNPQISPSLKGFKK